MKEPKDVLTHYWGHDSFRSPQEAIIRAVMQGKDTLALLPTGGGKSLCYQIPGLLLDGICLVISPLLSLMRDQVAGLKKRGINAIAFESTLSTDDIVALFDQLKFGNTKFLYLSPERLQSPLIIQKIRELRLGCIAVDEAHCISEWGHDFRPSYRKIQKIRAYFPDTNIIALTATATKKVITDIMTNLLMKDIQIFKKSFSRENLAYQIYTLENKTQKLLNILSKNQSSIIIYVGTRKKTEELSSYINSKGFKAVAYHGGMSAQEKQHSFDDWMSEKRPIIVATNAFGMGIDKPNVRVVVHMDLPYSIENYVQEAGRAGRDEKKAFSVVLQNENDIDTFKRNTIENTPSIAEIKQVHKRLYTHFQIAMGEQLDTAFNFNLQEFCERYQLKYRKTATILNLLKNHGIIDINQQFDSRSTIQILVSSNDLIHFKSSHTFTMQLLELILRNYGNIFYQHVKISEFTLAKKLNTTSEIVKNILVKLHDQQILEYNKVSSHRDLFFLVPREDDKTINRFSKSMERYLDFQKLKAKKLIQLVKNNQVCRSMQMHSYFGESRKKVCGICDVCLRNHEKKDLTSQLITLFQQQREMTKEEILNRLDANEDTILIHLRHLLRKDLIGLRTDCKLYLK